MCLVKTLTTTTTPLEQRSNLVVRTLLAGWSAAPISEAVQSAMHRAAWITDCLYAN